MLLQRSSLKSSLNWLRVLVLTATFVSLSAGAQAQVAIEQVKWDWDVGAASLDVTGVNTSIGSNTALVVAFCLNNNVDELPVSVTLDPDGTPTSLDWLDVGDQAASISGGDDGHCTVWGVKNPPSGTNFTVRAILNNATAGDEGVNVGVWSLSGVDQTTPFRDAVGVTDGTGTDAASITVPSQADDLVLAAAWNEWYNSATRLAVSGTGIEDFDIPGVDSEDKTVGQHKTATGTSTVLTWTNDNDPSPKWAAIGVAVLPAITTIGDGTSPANSSPAPSSTNNAVDAFTLSTNSAGTTDTVTALTVTFTGTAVADVAASGVKIYDDSTGSTPNEWDASDTLIGTASFSGTTASFSGLNVSVNNTATQYLVTYDLAAGATDTNTLQGAITLATVSNQLVNNDTTDATLTVLACPGGSVCWDGGGGTNNWSEGANWTTGVAPLTAELVVFNGLSTKNATFNAVDTIGSLTIEAGYTGTITLAATMSNDGSFTMNGGSLNMGSETVNQDDHWTYTAGSVNAGTSTVIFASKDLTVNSGAMAFNDVTLSMGGNTLTVTGTMDVDGDLTINSADGVKTGTIAVAGNVTTTDTSVGQSGAGKILIDGSGAQTLGASGTAGGLPAIEINNSGTLTIQDTIHMDDNWVFTGGTVDAGTSTVIFDGADLSITTGTMAFNNVTVNYGGAGNTITLTDTLDIDGNLTLTDVGDGFSGAGGIEVAGNLASTDVGCCHDSNATTLDGANAQTVDIATGNVPSGLFTINKASQADVVTLLSAMHLSASGQDLTLTTGCVDMAGLNLTIDGTLTLESGTTINQGGGTLSYGALVDNGGTLDGACPVGVSLAINSTNPGSLTESNLDTATVTVDLTDGTFDNPLVAGDFSLNGAPAGTTISAAAYVTATQATLTLAFDSTDFDTNASMSVTVLQTALLTGVGPSTSGTVTITAIVESSLAINSTNPGSLTETNLDTATVTVDLTDGTFNNPLAAGYFSLTGAPAGTTISAAAYVTATQATLTLAFDATDFDTNASMSVTALQTALLTGNGPATTGTVTVTAVVEPRLDQIHYRWRNDDGGEAGFDKGDGTDGALAPAGTFDLNTSTSGGRTYADGIAYRVVAPADTVTSVTRNDAGDTLSNGIAAGDEVLLINTQGASSDTADVGNYEFLEVQSVTASTITFTTSTTKSYDGTTAANQKVVVQRVPNYTSVTLDSGDVLTASGWNGLAAPTPPASYSTAIVVFRATGTVTVDTGGKIDVTGLGYRGGTGNSSSGGQNGESYDGTNGQGGGNGAQGTLGGGAGEEHNTQDNTVGTRGGGGGGGETTSGLGCGGAGGGGGGYGGGGGGGGGGSDSCNYVSGQGGSGGTTGDSAGGGGHGEDSGTSGTGGDAGSPGQQGGVSEAKGGGDPGSGATTGQGGHAEDSGDSPGGGGGGGGNYGTVNLPQLFFGSGGGAGGDHGDSGLGHTGGAGGGIIFIIADIVDNNATIELKGAAGTTATDGDGASGGGAGGSLLIWANNVDNTGGVTITADGGAGGLRDSGDDAGGGGGGGDGRIRFEADTIVQGTMVPAPGSTSGTPAAGGTPATFGPAEDAALTGLTKNTTKRLRIEISNEGTVTSGSVKYRLEVSEPNPPSSLCASATTWTRVDTSTHWNMAASTYFADADATQDINPGLTNANDDFKAGELKETTDETTAGIILTTTEFTEIEYAIAATNSATGSGIYCFRLTDAGTATNFTYTEGTYGKVTLGPDLDFGFRKSITIDRTKLPTGCGTTLSNYPLLFSVTDTDLSTASGQVTDAEGDDILFRALDDDTCGGVGTAPCTLDHEIESYNATTGAVVAWVRLPSVKTADASNTTDTQIYVYYGNTDIASSIEDINGVWDVNYKGVWHFNEDPAVAGTDGIKDSTSQGNHGTDFGGMDNADWVDGKINKSLDFDGTDDRITGAFTDITGYPFTLSMWSAARAGDNGSYRGALSFGKGSNTNYFGIGWKNTTGVPVMAAKNTGFDDQSGPTIGVDIFTHVVATYASATDRKIYVDGDFFAQDTSSVTELTDATTFEIGRVLGGGTLWGFVSVDEARISNMVRTACWITTDYNNQKWPDKDDHGASGFFGLGTEESTAGLTAVELISFTATGYDRGVLLDWRTGYEIDNLGFHVYREQAGERIQLTPALIAGSGLLAERGMAVRSELAYAWWDLEASRETPDIAYWLEDVDFDGVSTWHGPVTPVDGGHLIDVGPPAPGEGVEGSNSRSLKGLGQALVAQRQRFLAGDEDEAVGFAGGPPPSLVAQWLLAGQPGVKLGIERAGWYRVGQPALVAAGLDPSVHPRALRLVVDGVEHALHVTGSVDGRFDPEDAIEFYGEGVDTAYTGTRVYWVVAGAQAGQRVRVGRPGPSAGLRPQGPWPEGRAGLGRDVRLHGRAAPGGGPVAGASSFWGTLEQKDRSIYFAALRNGEAENWFGPLVWAFPTDLVLTLAHLDPAAPSAAALEVTLQGVTRDDAIDPDHTVTVLVNGTAVGDLLFDGRAQGVQTFAVPHALLQEGANTVQLVAQGAVDYSLVDTLRLSYWHTYEADADRLRFVAEGQERVTVGGFTSGAIRVVDVTDETAVEEVLGPVQPEAGGFWSKTVVAPGTGRRTLLAFTDATVGTPASVEANQPSTWHAGADQPDYLVITHRTFVDSLAALVALRAQQGYTPALIDIEDIYDEFSFGQKTPQALKDFLTRAQMGYARFVVLAGDATSDPRDYAGFGDADFVPTKLVDMDAVELESATDEWFADADGDGLPELAVGRLPMRTVEQAETMVAKLVTYAQAAAGAWTKEVVLLADSDDPTWSFEVDAAQIRDVLPAGYTAHSVLAGAAGGAAAARTELLDLVGQGQLLVNYMGHGSTYVWGKHADLLTSADVTGGWQPQAGLPIVLAMNCLNGFFQGIYGEESLAETFLRAPQGAVAMWASSGITYAAAQGAVNQEFIRVVFGGRTQTVGEAVVAAKQVVTDRDVRRSWIFFGDPAMRLKGVPQAVVPYDVSASTPAVGPTVVAELAGVAEVAAVDGDAPDPADAAVEETDETPAVRPAAARHLADFDGDGRADVFVYAPETGHWYLALTQAHDFRYHSGQWAPGLALVAAQLTDDGLADLFGYDAETGAWVQALNRLTQTDHLYDRGAGPFMTHAGVWAPGWQVGVGDLDGDGRDDVFVSDAASGLWFQSLTDGAGGFTYRRGRGLPVGQVHLPDFNGDGRADLFVNDANGANDANDVTKGRWSVGLNDGAGGFTFTRGQGTAGFAAQVANLDGNAWADLFLFQAASGAWGEWLTQPTAVVRLYSGQWAAGGAVHVADLEGDGHDDVVWYDPSSGAWASHLARGPGRFSDAAGVWAPGAQVAVGDLDGDGRADVFLYHAETGAWSRQLSDGRGGFTATAGQWSIGWTVVGR